MGRRRRFESRFTADERRLKRRLMVWCGVVACALVTWFLYELVNPEPEQPQQAAKPPEIQPFTLVPPPEDGASDPAAPATAQSKRPRMKGKRARRRPPVDLPEARSEADLIEAAKAMADAAPEADPVAPAPPPPPPVVAPTRPGPAATAAPPTPTGRAVQPVGSKKKKKKKKRRGGAGSQKVAAPSPPAPKENPPTGVTVQPGESSIREVTAQGVD